MTLSQENIAMAREGAAGTEKVMPPSDSSLGSRRMSGEGRVKERFEDIRKSPNDTREYRGLVLHNDMKVLLISDPQTDKSAASLDVNIGYFSDPPELPGLAHFCEHMLFMGTSKYPAEDEYNQFLSQNGGSGNAATTMDHTNYHFDVNPDKFRDALDRFSQFFTSPLFAVESTEKEINAVHSEHEKNVASDNWRLDQLDKFSSKPGHVYAKFGTGSRETLEKIPKEKGIDVREALLKFHKELYSSNVMALSVLGKESLDRLEEMVVSMFGEVENKQVEVPVWPEHPFGEEHFLKKWYIVPVKDIRRLNVIFRIPDLQEYYRSEPGHYVSHLLGHEGKGSLLSALKENQWCNALISGKKASARGFNFFAVCVDLTEEGMDHVDDIVTLIFQYVNMLRKEGPVEWIFEEYKNIAEMNFRFKEKSLPRACVNYASSALQQFPIPEVLTALRLYSEWRPDLIEMVLGCLVPENVRLQVVGKAFEGIADATEPFYGTKYRLEPVPEATVAKWRDAGLDRRLRLPSRNPFIPTEFALKAPAPGETPEKFPVIIEDSAFMRVWFKQDDEFLLPKANLTFDFVSPLAYLDPLNSNLTYMFVQLFRDELNEYAYAAELAGLKWELINTKYGLTFVVGGYDHKQHILLERIMERMLNFRVDPHRFEILKENYLRTLRNFEAEQPYQHAVYYLAVLLVEHVWLKDELLAACSQLTAERVQEHVPQLLSKVHVECLVHGNMTRKDALEVSRIVERKLLGEDAVNGKSPGRPIYPLLPKQLVLHREVSLDDGAHFLFEVENKLHRSSCTEVYYQSGLQSTEENMRLELLAQIISAPCFNVLRTKEQLGYIVFSGIRRTNGAQGLRVIVQSERHPAYVESRIDLFMDSMLDHIANMSEEEFNRHKESLATQRLEKPKTLSQLSAVFWNEISSQLYNFDRVNIEVAYLRTITRDQILQFFKQVIHNKSPVQHKLSVHVISTAEGGAGCESSKDKPETTTTTTATATTVTTTATEETTKPVKIEDIVAFKTSQSLYPLTKPFNDIPRKGAKSKL